LFRFPSGEHRHTPRTRRYIGRFVCILSLCVSGLVGGTAEAAPKKLSFVVAPGAPAFLINLAKKRTFAPCKTPPPKMLCIPGGIYVRGSQRNAQHANWKMRAESPRHYVILDTYYIDKYEVTHADFQKCL
jgi:formylglycine-generating enzyme required for sulfatase activity